MSIERQRHAFALLREALDLPAGQRAGFIAAHCGEDPLLAEELRAWLAADTRSDLLDRPAEEIAADLAQHADLLAPGARVGPWRVVRVLGSGGMGVVYLVQRDGEGYAQRGALKLIKRGMDSAAVLARFRRERQILSRLNHPNIAHLLDGGIRESGQPFLVMEYVDGETLATWIARTNAALDARVALFLDLCDAVAYAHRQLVVHRDIKPGNVLVDAAGRPRLLDFGIAKLLEEGDEPERTATVTRFVSRAYAAPEQTGDGAITTATDVYQLGALLFELLTDSRHADAPTTPRVSQRLAQARAKTASVIEPRVLQGDPGVILARATDPDPMRRYATVEAFADDLRRWRAGQPIRARADSAGYRLRLFVRRNRLMVAAAALALAAIVGGAGIALWQARAAAAQGRLALERAETAERVKRFMIGLFQAPDPEQARGAMPRADELLDRGARQIAGDLAGEPRLQAELYETMALSYMNLGRFETGVDLLERAREGLAGDGDDALAARIETLSGSAYAELGRYEQALSALERAVRLRGDAADPRDTARIEAVRGWVLRDLGRYADSEAALRRSLALAQAGPDDMNPAALRALNNLAYTLQLAGRKDESIAAYQRVVDWFAAHVPADQPARLWAESTFGKSLRDLGEPARARALLERIRPPLLKNVGEAHTDLAGLDIALGQARMDLGDAGGYAQVVDAVARSHRATPQRNMLWAHAEFALAEAEQRAGHDVAASDHYQAARAAYAALAGAAHPAARESDARLAAIAAARAARPAADETRAIDAGAPDGDAARQ
ncbi:serine/threonine-protein kinase [Dokdonella sp.]|uniref:serine/threonine-protein kinase n=1 Tax=Dokdonella sp. TaxID=2291710 RepID=UPI001B24522A|nr:serine/threonine-protein kinase [Dokdonella sp.]MBO9662960.1 serine/threonine protein kinase [Dokdonella sp.]